MRRQRLTALLALIASAAALAFVIAAPVVSSPGGDRASTASVTPSRGGDEKAPTARRRADRTAAQRRLARLRRLDAGIRWRRSSPVGTHNAGRLAGGVKLPPEGVDFFTLDPVRWTTPNRPERRWGTDRLLRTVLEVARGYARAHPKAPRIAIGDLSRPGGGPFDARYGIVGEFGPGRGTLGHLSHANGLDVDVYYPRRDGRERGPRSLGQADLALAQDLVDRFVAAGAKLIIVGERTGLTGPPGVVIDEPRHDDHLHIRLPAGR